MSGKRALVTGASSGIGRAVAERLAGLGYEVTGVGRNFRRDESGIRQMILDLTDEKGLRDFLMDYRREGPPDLLVHCAGVAWYGMAEEMDGEKVRAMIRTNLEVPMIITGALLRDIKSVNGTIIFISSVTADGPSPRACVYGAAKAGLTAYADSLFAENRKYGLKVSVIEPDLTDTNLYRNADFKPEEGEMYCLSPEDTADAVEFIVTRREGEVLTHLTLRPQKNRIRKT
ncbi:MAG: SDR family NAD(P)-dependent oxidoreductase [Lachnospira sp.]|nr:SDR family NAD(P)-dependent oxidoreductase [Lachnospira sp.]